MRLGKEQATGVIQEPAEVRSIPVDDEPGQSEVEQARPAAAPVSGLSGEGALIRSR